MNISTATSKMKELHCCVVLPTYNNSKTLQRVLDGILAYTEDIVLINDGSTDDTVNILKNYPQIIQIHQPKNTGKGNALKTGFKHAVSLGFEYAITLDTDGQHFPSDIPDFIEKLDDASDKSLLLIGDRNMNEADVFSQSAKGNRVSSYWVKALTGLKLRDSQSGFRLYPIKALNSIRFMRFTGKFEFEVEVIVKAHWAGIKVQHVPIHVLYDSNERVSHFRPFMDIARIVVLIIWFLIVKGLYIIPRDFFRQLKKKGFKRFFKEDFLKNHDSPKKKAFSIALGLFLGLSPLWGFHTVIVIFLAIVLRLNKVIAFTFSNISLPPFIPLVLFLSLQTGNMILGTKTLFSIDTISENFDAVQHLKSYLVGSIILSVTASVFFGFLGYILFSLFDRRKMPAHE